MILDPWAEILTLTFTPCATKAYNTTFRMDELLATRPPARIISVTKCSLTPQPQVRSFYRLTTIANGQRVRCQMPGERSYCDSCSETWYRPLPGNQLPVPGHGSCAAVTPSPMRSVDFDATDPTSTTWWIRSTTYKVPFSYQGTLSLSSSWHKLAVRYPHNPSPFESQGLTTPVPF
jgi:hypothetical protein